MQLDDIVRRERAQIVAHLVRMVGDVDRAEELFQATVVASFEAWSKAGIPEHAGAWLMTAAKNRAIDVLRKEKRVNEWHTELQSQSVTTLDARDEGALFPDDRLRLIFTCCHPALPQEAQVAMTLRLVCGLTTEEVARAFLVSEPTIQQRLVRAKRHIREARLPYEVPEPEQMAQRLAPVLQVANLVFNEGYAATSGATLTRVDLAEEGTRLAALLVELMPQEPEARGLLALMQLQSSRAHARVDAHGGLVLLEEQDRSQWDRALIDQGLLNLHVAQGFGAPGPYQLQAHIAATHARAAKWDDTDWPRIAALYQALAVVSPSAVVTLNRSVAVAMVEGPAAGLKLLDAQAATPALREYHLLPATRADFLRRLGKWAEAAAEYRRALALTRNEREREYLERRLAACVSISN